jgi:hypothetical protein
MQGVGHENRIKYWERGITDLIYGFVKFYGIKCGGQNSAQTSQELVTLPGPDTNYWSDPLHEVICNDTKFRLNCQIFRRDFPNDYTKIHANMMQGVGHKISQPPPCTVSRTRIAEKIQTIKKEWTGRVRADR